MVWCIMYPRLWRPETLPNMAVGHATKTDRLTDRRRDRRATMDMESWT